MKREEQTRIMRNKIIQSAIIEFNKKEFELASMNDICIVGEISKGIIYHYFKDKDALYLACVQACYDALSSYYEERMITLEDQKLDISDYMLLRMDFFRDYPQFHDLFFHALLHTPRHLQDTVKQLGRKMDELNQKFYKQFLMDITLKDHISMEKATLYMDMIQQVFNDYFRRVSLEETNFEEVIKKHEALIPEWINNMLYGIAKEK